MNKIDDNENMKKIYIKLFLDAGVYFGAFTGIFMGLFIGMLSGIEHAGIIKVIFHGLGVGFLTFIFGGTLFGLFTSLLGGTIQLICIRRFKKTGDIGPNQSKSIVLDIGVDEAFNKCIQAMNNLDWTIENKDKNTWTVQAWPYSRGKYGFFEPKAPYGVAIDLKLEENLHQTTITISSSPKNAWMIIDFGIGLMRIEELIKVLTSPETDTSTLQKMNLLTLIKKDWLFFLKIGVIYFGTLLLLLSIIYFQLLNNFKSHALTIACFVSNALLLAPILIVVITSVLISLKYVPPKKLLTLDIVMLGSILILGLSIVYASELGYIPLEEFLEMYWDAVQKPLAEFLTPFIG